MSQIKEHLNNKFEEKLEEIKANRNKTTTSDEEDASNSENNLPRRKYASNTKFDKNKSQDNYLQSSNMHEVRQLSIPLGVVNEKLDETVIINENWPEADYHRYNTVRHKRLLIHKSCSFLTYLQNIEYQNTETLILNIDIYFSSFF